MALARFKIEEGFGFTVAVAAHLALLAVLLLHAASPPAPVPVRMTVNLADDVGLQAASPQPAAPPAPSIAPTLGQAAPQAVPEPKPSAAAEPEPAPAKPAPSKAAPVRPAKHSASAADPIAAAIAATAASHAAHKASARPMTKPAGGARIGKDFLAGLSASDSNAHSAAAPAPLTGAAKAALVDAIARQLKPHWVLPDGVDAEKLVSVLSWDLNPDGTLASPPVLVRQEGITASNSPQAGRHAEMAKRAVLRAAPFQLPPQYYAAWKHIRAFRFDGELAQ